MTIERRWQLVFDGGSKGNPGLGYGTFRLRPAEDDEPWGPHHERTFGDEVTNNEAEYMALIEGLDEIARMMDPETTALEVIGDSQLVLKQLGGEWKVRAVSLRPYFAEARQRLDRFADVTLTWHGREHSVELLGH